MSLTQPHKFGRLKIDLIGGHQLAKEIELLEVEPTKLILPGSLEIFM